MLPKKHFIYGLIFSLILYLIFPQINLIGFVIVFLSSFLIDVDHYVYYVFKKKDLSLKNAYSWSIKRGQKYLSLSKKQRDKFPPVFCFLHGIEILIILFLLGFFISKYFYFILIGFGFHLFLDFINKRNYQDRINKISIIYYFIKIRKLKRLC